MEPNTPVWDDHPWTPLPPLKGDVETDVCVVGLGGSGLSAVSELLAHGARVVGLEAAGVAGGAAGRNGGFLLAGTAMFYHDAVTRLGQERACRIYRLTLEEMDFMTAQTPKQVRRVGSLRIAGSEGEWDDCQAQLQAMQRDGFAVERYDGPEGRGLLFPADGVLHPLGRCRALALSALSAGARLFERSPALSLSGTEVTTPDGRVRCRAVIVALDGRLEALLPELSGHVRTARLQMLATAPTREITLPCPVYVRWGYEYYQQLPDGRMTLGGFRDAGGEAEWESSGEPSEVVQGRLEAFLRDDLKVSAPIIHRWAAPVGYTASGLPVLDEVRPKLWALGGYSGTGNVVGALLGRAAAKLALGLSAPEAELFAQM
jgi:gamma-glutamylputrescine oxidase